MIHYFFNQFLIKGIGIPHPGQIPEDHDGKIRKKTDFKNKMGNLEAAPKTDLKKY
jgi:hypothetical protein